MTTTRGGPLSSALEKLRPRSSGRRLRVFVSGEEAAVRRFHAEQPEVVAGHDEPVMSPRLGIAARCDGEPGLVGGRKIVQRCQTVPQQLVLVPGGRNIGTSHPDPDADQFLLVVNSGKRPQERRIHQCERRRGRGDAECEASDDRDGEACAAAEPSQRVANVLVERVEDWSPTSRRPSGSLQQPSQGPGVGQCAGDHPAAAMLHLGEPLLAPARPIFAWNDQGEQPKERSHLRSCHAWGKDALRRGSAPLPP